MKVTKIETKDGPCHYVDGGPACPVCNGLGRIPTIVPNIPNMLECPICHGTGGQAVEEWPDAELDRALNTRFTTWALHMRRELHTDAPVYQVEGEPWAGNMPCGDTSREAKIAAVIAVAEEKP